MRRRRKSRDQKKKQKRKYFTEMHYDNVLHKVMFVCICIFSDLCGPCIVCVVLSTLYVLTYFNLQNNSMTFKLLLSSFNK